MSRVDEILGKTSIFLRFFGGEVSISPKKMGFFFVYSILFPVTTAYSYYLAAKYLLSKILERTDWSRGSSLNKELKGGSNALLEIVTYGFAVHQRAHHIGVVGVGHVPHPRGHPPAEGGVHEFNKLFVERGSQEVHLRLDVRERERARGGSSRN